MSQGFKKSNVKGTARSEGGGPKTAHENVATKCIEVIATVQVNAIGDYLPSPHAMGPVYFIAQQIKHIAVDFDDHWGAVIATRVHGPWKTAADARGGRS